MALTINTNCYHQKKRNDVATECSTMFTYWFLLVALRVQNCFMKAELIHRFIDWDVLFFVLFVAHSSFPEEEMRDYLADMQKGFQCHFKGFSVTQSNWKGFAEKNQIAF